MQKNNEIGVTLVSCIITFALGLFAVPIQQFMLSPRSIKIEFKSEKPFIINAITRGKFSNKLYDIYSARFKIRNNSSTMARNCIVMVTKYWHMDSNRQEFVEEANFEPLRIGWSSEAMVDIGPGREIFVPFMKIAEVGYQLKNEIGIYGLSGDCNVPQLRFAAPSWPRWMSSHIPVGKHQFLITIYFDNRDPLEQKFEVDLTDDWNSDHSNILDQITIKNITDPDSNEVIIKKDLVPEKRQVNSKFSLDILSQDINKFFEKLYSDK